MRCCFCLVIVDASVFVVGISKRPVENNYKDGLKYPGTPSSLQGFEYFGIVELRISVGVGGQGGKITFPLYSENLL